MNNLLYSQEERETMGLVNCSKVYAAKSQYGPGGVCSQSN